MRYVFALLILMMMTGSAYAGLTLDLASDRVDITTGFDGARIHVYGHNDTDGDVIIVVKGPQDNMVVRRKRQVVGMWINRQNIEFKNVYTYYDFAATGNLANIGNGDIYREHDIGLDYLDYASEETSTKESKISRFHEALIRIKQSKSLYPLQPQEIQNISDQFFKTAFDLPPNVPTGRYKVEGYLFRGGEIVDTTSLDFRVGQVGNSAEIYKFAHGQSLFYGIAAVLIAIGLGWSANSILRKD